MQGRSQGSLAEVRGVCAPNRGTGAAPEELGHRDDLEVLQSGEED